MTKAKSFIFVNDGDRRRRCRVCTMDAVLVLLQALRRQALAPGQFLGLLNILIGRCLEGPSGQMISTGLTWRTTAHLLKKVRWDKEAVRDLELNPKSLPPRDRERYWYAAISKAPLESEQARLNAQTLAKRLLEIGYHVR